LRYTTSSKVFAAYCVRIRNGLPCGESLVSGV
jgi:hypothetical protein